MPYDFPNNPALGQKVTFPSSSQIFTWDGVAWVGGDVANLVVNPNTIVNASISASYALTASYFSGSVSNAILSQTAISSSHAQSSSISVTASYVSGAVLNIPDSFTSLPPCNNIVTLTGVEYAGITPDPQTLYIIVI